MATAKMLLLKPQEVKLVEVNLEIKDIQLLVEGHFEIHPLGMHDYNTGVSFILNEKDKFLFGSQPPTAVWVDGYGKPIDKLYGPILFCGSIVYDEKIDDDVFEDIKPEHIKEIFKHLEMPLPNAVQILKLFGTYEGKEYAFNAKGEVVESGKA